MIKIAIAQCNFLIGDFEYNTTRILEGIRNATHEGADLIVFPELALTGYPVGDLLEYEDFISKCEFFIKEIAVACTEIAAIIGSPSRNRTGRGKPLYNSAWFLNHGKVEYIANKSLLPNYDIFDEYRFFEPSHGFGYVDYKGYRLALTICEDIWNTAEIPMYSFSPLEEVSTINPDIIINISASPFNYNQSVIRKQVLRADTLKYGKPIVYVNHVGAQAQLIFDGNSMVCDAGGNIRDELACFEEDIRVVEIRDDYFNTIQSEEPQHSTDQSGISLIHDALILGIKDYFRKMGFQKAILGLSGGIDSAVTMVLAAKALGAKNVKGVLLPSAFSSDHSINDAKQLALNLGCPVEMIRINDAVAAIEDTLKPFFKGLPFDVTEENIQARTRAVLLMAMSNKFGYILLNTSNKSEAAVGYGTLYGDMCGGISVLGDVYKTDVYKLADYINRQKEIIPVNTIVKPPSAELHPGQKDSDSLPDYDLLDQILYLYIEMHHSADDITKMGFDDKIVQRVIKMVNRNEWKRAQAPPTLRISPKAFGSGRRMPLVAKYL